MSGNIRNYFPGGNTSRGFYSYYQYIQEQKEANQIVCIKGGPGTGKSTFMRTIAEHFLEKGEDVDFFWCSSDPGSIDGILLKQRKTAFLDGTSPHITDPVTPGAVDTIIHLGEWWNEKELKQKKNHILKSNDTIKCWFSNAYNCLKAANEMRVMMKNIYQGAICAGEVYKTTADIIRKEFACNPVSLSLGKCKKYFATAITPLGIVNHMPSLIKSYKKIYCLNSAPGIETADILKMISDSVVHRGISVEEFYCPMDPENNIEHLLIPEMEMAFITLNDFHDMDMWECSAATNVIEMREFIDWNSVDKYSSAIRFAEEESERLINKAIMYLKKAKQEHDVLEGYYVPNMDFEKISELADEWIAKTERLEL